MRASLRSRLAVGVLSLAVLLAVGAAGVRAGGCRVLVALGAIEIEPSPAGLSVKLSGNWEFDNLVQVVTGLSFNVLLVRGDQFIRIAYPDQGYIGELPGLGERVDAGLDGNDIVSIEAAGASEPKARFVSVEAQRINISAPILPVSGPVSVIAYLVLDGDYVSPIISNTLSRQIAPLAEENSEQGASE